ncbi:MAG: endonuclease/exonuclease/phosphatase family protein [Dehalococcoidia bacterium]
MDRTQSEIKVSTLNVHGRGPGWRARRVELVRQLVALDVDAISLQELRTWPSQGAWLARASSPPGPLSTRPWRGGARAYTFVGARKRGLRGYEGIGVVTRLPVLEREIVPLGAGGRVALRCRLDVGGTAFDLYSVHFQHGSMTGDIRLRGAERLLTTIEARGGPAVVAGDLNGPPESRALQLLTGTLRSTQVVVHGMEPASTVAPVERGTVLDYILVSDGIEVLGAGLAFDEPGPGGEMVSDHLGLVSRIRLLPGS